MHWLPRDPKGRRQIDDRHTRKPLVHLSSFRPIPSKVHLLRVVYWVSWRNSAGERERERESDRSCFPTVPLTDPKVDLLLAFDLPWLALIGRDIISWTNSPSDIEVSLAKINTVTNHYYRNYEIPFSLQFHPCPSTPQQERNKESLRGWLSLRTTARVNWQRKMSSPGSAKFHPEMMSESLSALMLEQLACEDQRESVKERLFPRTLSTSVLRIKHRSSFWERFFENHRRLAWVCRKIIRRPKLFIWI